MWPVILPAAAALAAGYIFVTRGKAHIGDDVIVLWKPDGGQGVRVQGKVTSKENPILGPYYSVQPFQIPKIVGTAGELLGINPDLIPPNSIDGLRDTDIIRNISREKRGGK